MINVKLFTVNMTNYELIKSEEQFKNKGKIIASLHLLETCEVR